VPLPQTLVAQIEQTWTAQIKDSSGKLVWNK
jgi:hypothetical protein